MDSKKGTNGEQDRLSVLCNLILEVTSHLFCCILLIRSKALGPVHTEGEGLYKNMDSGRWRSWELSQRLPTMMRHCPTAFKNMSHFTLKNQPCMRVLVAPHIWRYMSLLIFGIFFLMLITPLIVKCHLIMVFLFISLMTNDFEELFWCLMSIYIDCFGKYFFKKFAH